MSEFETNQEPENTYFTEIESLDPFHQTDKTLFSVLQRNNEPVSIQNRARVVPSDKWKEISVIIELIKKSPQYEVLESASSINLFSENPLAHINRLLFTPRFELSDEERALFDNSFTNSSRPPLFEPYEPDEQTKHELLETAEEELRRRRKTPLVTRQKDTSVSVTRNGLLSVIRKRLNMEKTPEEATENKKTRGLNEEAQFEMLNQAYHELMQKVGSREFLNFWTRNYTLIETAIDNYMAPGRLVAEELEEKGFATKFFSVGGEIIVLLDKNAGELYRQVEGTREFFLLTDPPESLEEIEKLIAAWKDKSNYFQVENVDLTGEEKKGLVATYLTGAIQSKYLKEDEKQRYRENLARLKTSPLNQPQLRRIIARVVERVIAEQSERRPEENPGEDLE